MKICPKCKTKYESDEDVFCGECGTRLATVVKEAGSNADSKSVASVASEMTTGRYTPKNTGTKRSKTGRKIKPKGRKPAEYATEIDFYKFFSGGIDSQKQFKRFKDGTVPQSIFDDFKPFDRSTSAENISRWLESLQGRISEKRTNSDDKNKQDLLTQIINIIEMASGVFRSEDSKQQYDKALDEAYAKNQIEDPVIEDLPTQPPQNIWHMIDALFEGGNYIACVAECDKLLEAGINDVRPYNYKAMASYELGDKETAIRTVYETKEKFPDDEWNLRLGARFAAKDDAYETAQNFINDLSAISPNSPLAASEQCYLYERLGKQDLALTLIDDYLEKNPHNEVFRSQCAYDLMELSNTFYKRDPNNGAYIIAEKEDYERCLAVCEKAATIYNNDYISSRLDDVRFYGQTEYNWDNKWHILALVMGGVLYALCGLPMIAQAGAAGLGPVLLGAGLIFCGYRLHKVSYRPYWQINKYYMTGKREPVEARYIMIGKIFVGFVKWSFKISWWIIWFFLKLVFRSAK